MGSLVYTALASAAPGSVSVAAEVTGATSFAWQAEVSGSPSLVNMWLEGSLDGATWFRLDSFTVATNPDLRFVVDKPVKYVRVNFSGASGGTSPVATVTILAI